MHTIGRKRKKSWKKRGLIIGALFLLYLVSRPFLTNSGTYVRSALAEGSLGTSSLNSQTLYLPQPALTRGIGGSLDENISSDRISVYVVHEGDRLSDIAKMFGVTENTIIWANDLKRGAALKVDQHLIILPVSGVQYTVLSGDTLTSIAKKHKGDVEEIKSFNNLAHDTDLRPGDHIIIPDGEETFVSTSPTAKSNQKKSLPSMGGYFADPLPGHRRTQGLHGHNGVDLTLERGASIRAAAAGTVIISKNNGAYNGGYGNYVVIAHNNGTQTLYSHLEKTLTQVGAQVSQGQTIGFLGNTGKSTGPHLHFEVRGAKNPF